ncbi:MAG: hydrogenase maturation protease [Myxococcales bacterium]|nr:hydrogenase maturation protease [Myxococcales bacterium]
MARVHVIGFGNRYQGDDGFGPAVCRLLQARPLPRDVRVFDAGTAGLNALSCFEGCARAIVLDAVGGPGPAGRLLRLSPDDPLPPARAFSAHALGLDHLLRVLPLALDRVPALEIIGAVVDNIRPFGLELSPPLAEAAARAVDLICRAVGAHPAVEPSPLDADRRACASST